MIQATDEDLKWMRSLVPSARSVECVSPDPLADPLGWPSALVILYGATNESVIRLQSAIDNRRALSRAYGGPHGFVRVAAMP